MPKPTSSISGPPFTLPPGATLNGAPAPFTDASLFSTFGAASEMYAQVYAALLAAGYSFEALPTGSIPLGIWDAMAGDPSSDNESAQFALPNPPSPPYTNEMVGIWEIRGNIMNAAGLCFIDDGLGSLIKRGTYPQPGDGDKNVKQVGLGGNAKMVGVVTKIAIEALPQANGTTLLQSYWAAPAA